MWSEYKSKPRQTDQQLESLSRLRGIIVTESQDCDRVIVSNEIDPLESEHVVGQCGIIERGGRALVLLPHRRLDGPITSENQRFETQFWRRDRSRALWSRRNTRGRQ